MLSLINTILKMLAEAVDGQQPRRNRQYRNSLARWQSNIPDLDPHKICADIGIWPKDCLRWVFDMSCSSFAGKPSKVSKFATLRGLCGRGAETATASHLLVVSM
jgi:hypothetical protein